MAVSRKASAQLGRCGAPARGAARRRTGGRVTYRRTSHIRLVHALRAAARAPAAAAAAATLLCALHLRGASGAASPGAANTVESSEPGASWDGPCTISRDPTERSWERPFIVRAGASDDFRARTDVAALREAHGAAVVTLSSANTFSYGRRRATLAEYLDSLADPGLAAAWALADGTAERGAADALFYWFGEHDVAWAALLERYDTAPLLAALPPPGARGEHGVREPILSFGAGAHLSGVPFHQHGPGFSETLHGAKRWLFFDGAPPRWMPNATAAHWLAHVLPTLAPRERARMLECTVRPGEAVFFPDGWMHATVNVPGEARAAVFVSTFL
ncbi:hypothetical protein KFE25_000103 [Diacronema lutheri]|uniref:JmjC domain-containing protein n=2 Tax=Diacronema lutheri TaxID=2081491 RepID=A0A8J5XIK1_DIALT|nr:hypothetical protein KFE25_000103 [Diacronema lutheri]